MPSNNLYLDTSTKYDDRARCRNRVTIVDISFRYDEDGRRITTVQQSAGLSYTAHEVYDCP